MAKGRNSFTAGEADEIRELLRRVRTVGRSPQKHLRAQLRATGFYISDWGKSGDGFTVEAFDDLVERGLVTIEGTPDRHSSSAADEVEWLSRLLEEVFHGRKARRRSIDPVGGELLSDDWTTIQRVALGRSRDQLALCTWPGELKDQAVALYQEARVERLLGFLEDHGEWNAVPRPHLAFPFAKVPEILYLTPSLDAASYMMLWSEPDTFAQVGAHPADTVRSDLWPWLCQRGVADPTEAEDGRLAAYIERLEHRRSQAHLRPGVELRRSWDFQEATEADHEALVSELRETGRELLEALQEPILLAR